ncbi:MAG: tRNA (adenosine(37)-N6)-dimethylallyltransferase MiaA [Ignavibacteriae bacterium HGW-Ignavibacteriae-3]|nr:MAG: tRNA (adenosine(37)-N6)-dimethylallyltransferase MiaA [Ignavibacteriae bacterium HGW-Ignavibacteriae-3]
MERKVIVILGPTCSGKTDLGISVAEKLRSEIISADSRQIYKYLNIGTAKPTANVMKGIPHHFIDMLNPDQDYNVSRYENDALSVMNELLYRGKIPIVVGGSGLYIRALTKGIFDSVDNDPDYREELLEQREKFGNEFLYNQLKAVDPESAANMLPQNWKRVIRALEVLHLTGEPIWKIQQNHSRTSDLKFCMYGLSWDRETLYKNIEKRVDKMISSGLVDEVKQILDMGYNKNINSLNTVGYKEIISYLENEISLDRAIELIKRNTRRYAKRQLTWFRKDELINWLPIATNNDLNNAGNIILKNFS